MSEGTGKVALVTGGGTGIGAATAVVLRDRGWDVMICGRRAEQVQQVARDTGAVAIQADVTRREDVTAVIDKTLERFGRLDGVVLNAGIVREGTVADLSDDDWDATMATNVTAPFHIAKEALPHLIATGGSFVGVASAAALRATASIPAYNCSKAALMMLMQSIAVDHGAQGIRANVICPGWTRTEMADMEMTALGESIGVTRDDAYGLATAFVPSRRAATAAEIAHAIAWMMSPGASYLNAAVIPVDGGLIAVEAGQIGFDPRVTVDSSSA